MSDNDVIDPELQEALENVNDESQIIGQYSGDGNSGDTEGIEFVGEWFPNEEQWQGKTAIAPEQARPLAMVRHLPEVFEELEDLEPFLEGAIRDYEQYLTSIEGGSRQQQMQILKAMMGGATEEEEAAGRAVMSMFSAPTDDD